MFRGAGTCGHAACRGAGRGAFAIGGCTVNEIMVVCPVCAREVLAALAGAGLVLGSHLVPGTRFPCPQGATLMTSCAVESWRRQPQASPGRPAARPAPGRPAARPAPARPAPARRASASA